MKIKSMLTQNFGLFGGLHQRHPIKEIEDRKGTPIALLIAWVVIAMAILGFVLGFGSGIVLNFLS